MISSGRTCLPVRFVMEAFGLNVKWEEDNEAGSVSRKRVVISEGSVEPLKTLTLVIGEKEQ
jgi:hypothetical protein